MTQSSQDISSLDDLLVLELGDEATQYSGKLMADMGARVIKIEPPGGAACRHRGPFKDDQPDPNNSLYFWAYNANKESIVLDLTVETDRKKLLKLVEKADVLLEDCNPGYLAGLGLSYDDLARINPGLIMTSVTPFGQTGPLVDWKGGELVQWAMGGAMWLVGYADHDTPPLCPPADFSYQIGGQWAQIGTMAALAQRDATGEGQHVDVSIQEACSMVTEWTAPVFEYQGINLDRKDFLGGAIKCKDGKYFIPQMVNITPVVWSRLVDWLKKEEIGEPLYDDRYLDPEYLGANLPSVLKVIGEIAATRTSDELWKVGQSLGFTWMVFNAPDELLEDEQLKARNFFKEVPHPEHGTSYTYAGPPYEWSEAPWRIHRRPPLLGEDEARVAELL